jgi:hypothetical protein
MRNERECHGKMSPSLLHIVHNRLVNEKVFGYEVDCPGGVAAKAVAVNGEAWQDCMNCPESDACSRLSLGSALLEFAIRTLPDTLY